MIIRKDNIGRYYLISDLPPEIGKLFYDSKHKFYIDDDITEKELYSRLYSVLQYEGKDQEEVKLDFFKRIYSELE